MLLDVAAQLVRILLVFDRHLDVLRSVLVDLSKTVFFESHGRLVDGEIDVVGSVEPPFAYALLPVEQLSSGLQLTLPYSEYVRIDGVYVNPVVGQQLVGTVEVEVVALHQQLLSLYEAVCQRHLRIHVQNEAASARRDHLACVYHGCPSMPWSRGSLSSTRTSNRIA